MRDDIYDSICWQLTDKIGSYGRVINFDLQDIQIKCPLVIKKIRDYEKTINEELKYSPIACHHKKELAERVILQLKCFIGGKNE